MSIRIANEKDLPVVVRLYQNCYGESPWFEVFDSEELLSELKEILLWKDTIFLVYEHEQRIVGAAIGFSVKHKPDVRKLVPAQFKNAFYFSELFVDISMRNCGIGKLLIHQRISRARYNGYTHGIVRTSIAQPIVQHVYIDTYKYKIVATQETISTKVIEGVKQEAPDTRVIMAGTFPLDHACEH